MASLLQYVFDNSVLTIPTLNQKALHAEGFLCL